MPALFNALASITGQVLLEPVPPSYSKAMNYEFHEELDSGSHGKVIRATWTPPAPKVKRFSLSHASPQPRIVAVKIINKTIPAQVLYKNELREAIQHELSIMPELDHPNVVKCFEVFESQAYICISLEYLEGGPLFDRIYNDCRKFTESRAMHITKSILEGIKYLHDNDIVHHDLKPENIMMRVEGQDSDIVIVDFGLAQRVPANGVIKNTYITEEYAAPEMIWAKEHGKPIDLWAMGVIAHELLEGHLPFRANDEFSIVKAARCKLELPYPYWEDISGEAISFLKCLLCEVQYRYTAEQALDHRWFKRPIPDEEPILRGFHDNFNARKTWMKGINSTVATLRLSAPVLGSPISETHNVLDLKVERVECAGQTLDKYGGDKHMEELIEEVDLSSLKI